MRKIPFFPAGLAVLFLLNGCCTVSVIREKTWCQSEHRMESRKLHYSPEKHELEFTGTETAKFYFFPFDYGQNIPCWKTERWHHLIYRLNKPPPGSVWTRLKTAPSPNAPRFKKEQGIPCFPEILPSRGLPSDWKADEADSFRDRRILRIHPEDGQYLSGPFAIYGGTQPVLLIPAGGKDTYYTPQENRLLMQTGWTEYHPAVVWRAVWLLPAVAVDLIFWPIELVWLGIKGF